MKFWKKGFSLFCAAAAMTFLITGCSSSVGEEEPNKTVALNIICESLMRELDFPEMADVSNRYDVYYSLSDSTVKECRLYVCSSGAYPDELAVFLLNDPTDHEKLKTVINARREYLLETWKSYKPGEVPKIENSKLLEYSGYYFYVISENEEKASEVLGRYFG